MNYTFGNLLNSSFLLWLNNRLLTQTQAFYNYTGRFYPIGQLYNGYRNFSTSFKPLVADVSVPNATVITGVYVNNSYLTNGQSGISIDYENGNCYLPTTFPANSVVSGAYSFNEISMNLASFYDMTVLFETKLSLRSKTPQILTGLNNNQLSYPAVFIKNEVGSNSPFAFGGEKTSINEINCYIFAESQFQLDAIVSNFKDALHEYVPMLGVDEFPFNNMGGFKNNIPYNYTGIVGNRISQGNGALITDVSITDFTKRGLTAEVEKITTEAFFSLATFKIEKQRLTN